jgi:hypothetical protein
MTSRVGDAGARAGGRSAVDEDEKVSNDASPYLGLAGLVVTGPTDLDRTRRRLLTVFLRVFEWP